MTRILALLSICLTASVASAQAPHIIEGTFASKLPMKAETGAWLKAKPLPVTAYRQRTVRLVDRNVNKQLDESLGPRKAELKVIYNTQTLALQVSWDDTSSEQLEHIRHTFGDAVAFEVPQKFGAGEPLPYVGMGDITHPVIVAIKRAHKDATYERQFVAAGFGSLTRIDLNTKMSLEYDAEAKRWRAVFQRPLKDHNVNLAAGLVPVAIALWDGAHAERGGYKAIVPWRFIRLDKFPLDEDYLKYVSWGEDGQSIGDPAKGEAFAKENCVACHRFADQNSALEGVAPALYNIGGYGIARYLEESIKSPSAVVIRAPNLNRHYDRSAKPGKNGAYPNNPLYAWSIDAGEKPISKMPPFAQLSPEDIGNLVAYLKTLKHK